MFIIRKKSTMLAGMITALLLTSACGGSQTSAPPSADPVSPPAQPKQVEKPKDPIDLVFYQPSADWNEERFEKEFGSLIKAKFPHITPKLIPYNGKADQVTQMVTSNTQVDIMFMSIGQVYNFLLNPKMERDLTPFIEKDKYDLSRFEPTSIEILRQIGGGKLIGLPMYTLPATIYYNKDLFDKFGVPYPKDGMTWDETYELSKRMTREDGGVQYYGTVISPSHLAMRNQLSLNIIDPKTNRSNLNHSDWANFLNHVARFYTGYNWTNDEMQVGKQRDMFTKERRAAMWMPVSTMHTAEELKGMNWDLAEFPQLPEKPGVGPQAYPFYFFITATSKVAEDAFEVLKFLMTDEFHMEKSKQGLFLSLLNNKAIHDAFGTEAEMYKGKNTKALFPKTFAAPSYVHPFTATGGGRIFTALVNVVTGKTDVNSALREADELLNKAIEAANQAK
jgi:multiple sugar transport system substrate-binding protein